MNSRTKGTRGAALSVLALAVIMASALAWAAPGAVQPPADTGRDARTAQVSAPAQADQDDVGIWRDTSRGEDPGTTDGDPDIPMDSPRTTIELLRIRLMVLMAALGF